MKKNYIVIVCLLLAFSGYSQITFNGCHPLFENQDYIFTNVGTDATGRHIFETTPITGDQPCGGVGVCEFRIVWNNIAAQWEFLADAGNGDFTDVFLIYTNSNASTPNPPSLILGTWLEFAVNTGGACGGNLTTSNAILTGDVQDSTLSVSSNDELEYQVKLVPNPAKSFVTLMDVRQEVTRLDFYDINGKLVLTRESPVGRLDISTLAKGMYLVKIEKSQDTVVKKLVVN